MFSTRSFNHTLKEDQYELLCLILKREENELRLEIKKTEKNVSFVSFSTCVNYICELEYSVLKSQEKWKRNLINTEKYLYNLPQ